MRPKSLAPLAAVVLGLGAFIWFVERDLPSSDERAERAKKVLAFDEDDVDSLSFLPVGGDSPLKLVRQEKTEEAPPPSASRWHLVAPLEAAADDGAVSRLLSSLADLEKKRTLEDMPPQDAGLEQPRATVTVGLGNETTTLEIGAELPGSKTMLVAVTGDGAKGNEVYVVADTLLDQLSGEVDTWRNRKLFPAQRDDIESVRLEKGPSVVLLSFGEDGAWLEEPLRDRAEESLTNQLLQALVDLQAKSFLDDEPKAVGVEAGGLVEVTLSGRDEPWRIELGSTSGPAEGGEPEGADGGAVDARVDGKPVRLSGLSEALARPPLDWRSRAVLSLPVYRIDRVEVVEGEAAGVAGAVPGAEAAASPLELSRQEGDWLRGSERVSFSSINDLLYALADLRAEDFVDGTGLDGREAALTFTLTGTDSEGAGEEQVLRLFDRSGRVLALVTGRPDALLLDSGSLQTIRSKLDEVRKAEPLPAAGDAGDEKTP